LQDKNAYVDLDFNNKTNLNENYIGKYYLIDIENIKDDYDDGDKKKEKKKGIFNNLLNIFKKK
jgi:hypothetical protein